jgi:maltose-binding protein MalE
MKKTLSARLAVLVAISLLISTCGPTPEPTKPPEPTKATGAPKAAATGTLAAPALAGTITLWHAWKETEIPGLNEVIAAFQAKYPDVQFVVLYVPFDDLRAKFETAAAAGGGPTVLIGAADWGPAFYDAGLLTDLSTTATKEFLRTINPSALGSVKYKDGLIGLPHRINGVVMFRNKAIVPEAPATYEDLVAAAKAATQGDVVGANLERGFFFSAAHLNAAGGLLMDEKGNPLFNDEKGVEWLTLLNSFSEAGPAEYYTDNDVNLFKAGKAGTIIDGTWNATDLAESIGADNLSIDPWPESMSGYVQTENIYLGANAEGDDQKAAWEFMQFFLSPEAQAMLAKMGHIPAVAGVEGTDPLTQQAMKAFEDGTAFPVIPEMGAYWGPMDIALKSVFDEGADPATALQTAFDSITTAIEGIRSGQ